MVRSCKRAAFTIVELLVAAAIVAVLAAVGFSSVASSKRSARIVATLGRLHQCRMAVAMYSADGASANNPRALPSLSEFVDQTTHGRNFYGITSEVASSACGKHPQGRSEHFIAFLDEGSSLDSSWRNYVGRMSEQAVVFADENCNAPDVPIQSAYTTKLGLAVLQNGTLLRRRHTGIVGTHQFWDEQP